MAPKATVSALPDDEIPTVFDLMSRSFGEDAPFVNAYFPKHATPAGSSQGKNRLLAWKQSSPESVFLKATTTDQGKETIVGFAVWTLMKEAPPAELDDAEDEVEVTWPDESEREWMRQLWRSYVKPRSKVVNDAGGSGIWVLELLAVHPGYQRLGAGTALVKWGVDAADEARLKAVVEGTVAGRQLYEKFFKLEIEEMQFDVGDEFKDKRTPKLNFLIRNPPS